MVPAFIVPVEVRAAPQYGEGHCGVFATAPIRKGQKVWERLAKGNALKLGWLGLGGGLVARTTPPQVRRSGKTCWFPSKPKGLLKSLCGLHRGNTALACPWQVWEWTDLVSRVHKDEAG